MSEEPESQASPPSIQDQRDDTRFTCQGSVEFCIEGSDIRTFARVVDISFGGCYVEMTATSAPGTKLNLVIEVIRSRFNVKGIVRTSYPCLGMGIEFTDISPAERAVLSEILLELSTALNPPLTEQQKPLGSVTLPVNIDARAALDEISRFFESGHVLTRDEFLRLVARTL